MDGRISLFSRRRKLFSDNESVVLKEVKCRDCGTTVKTAANISRILCPNCGGKRMNIIPTHSHGCGCDESKRSIFGESKIDALPDQGTKLEKALKTYSGCKVEKDMAEKLFGIPSDVLCEKGYSEDLGDSVRINTGAYLSDKLFSKLTITITRELDLDPSICSPSGLTTGDKEGVISSLSRSMSPKGIMIIRRAHGLVGPDDTPDFDSDCESCCSGHEDWLKDSGILRDLPIEFGNRTLSDTEFSRMLSNRYDDAPSDILNLLENRGVINRDRPAGIIRIMRVVR